MKVSVKSTIIYGSPYIYKIAKSNVEGCKDPKSKI